MHILLVEDDPFIAKAVCAALESEAHAVTWTPTGREGLAVIATGTPDAVLLDLGLPGMDGIDVLKSIRAMTKPLCDTGAILSRRALEEKLYAPGDEPESNAVEYLIHSLRKKIGASAIENIRGLGWRVPADKNAAQ